MDFAISIVATKLLINGITSSYPCTNPDLDPEDRFHVHLTDYGSNEYVINDLDLELFPHLPSSLLEDTSFNLVAWYRQYINNFGSFELQYVHAHLGPGHPESTLSCPLGACALNSTEPSPDTEDHPDLRLKVEDVEEHSKDIPDLQMLSDAEIECGDVDTNLKDDNLLGNLDNYHLGSVGEVLIDRLNTVLTQCQPYPGDDLPVDLTYKEGEPQFIIENQDFEMYSIYD